MRKKAVAKENLSKKQAVSYFFMVEFRLLNFIE